MTENTVAYLMGGVVGSAIGFLTACLLVHYGTKSRHERMTAKLELLSKKAFENGYQAGALAERMGVNRETMDLVLAAETVH